MRLKKTTPAAAALLGLALAFAADSHAGWIPYSAVTPGQHFDASWNFRPDGPPIRGWAIRKPAPRKYDLAALLKQYSNRTHSAWALGIPLGSLAVDFPPPAPEGPGATEPDPEGDPDTSIAATLSDAGRPDGRLPDPAIPAVPEPDTLFMLGAGVLGLWAARALAKR